MRPPPGVGANEGPLVSRNCGASAQVPRLRTGGLGPGVDRHPLDSGPTSLGDRHPQAQSVHHQQGAAGIRYQARHPATIGGGRGAGGAPHRTAGNANGRAVIAITILTGGKRWLPDPAVLE